MIKEALEYLVGLKRTETLTLGTKVYADRAMEVIHETKAYPKEIELSTLESLVAYIDENKDGIDLNNAMLHITDYKTIALYTNLDEHMKRTHFTKCVAITPMFTFDRFMLSEEFNIGLQALFCKDAQRDKILKIIGNIKENNVSTSSDDGVTQGVIVNKGISLGEDEAIPNPVTLAPYRTFAEVKQPTSEFILRVREGREKPEIALFEADGGVWKLEAIQIIKRALEELLKEKGLDDKIAILA